ncbi:hypothetical protein ACR80S_03375 [Halomonas sp. MA07-2]|uniref:hypothetical protein n=1 Tax=unclassified Halomonas TaxID=2609666 RepID=UPI003EE8A40A
MAIRHFHAFVALTFANSWGLPGLGLLLSRLVPGFPFSLYMYSPLYYAGVWGQPWPRSWCWGTPKDAAAWLLFSDDFSTGGSHCAGGCSRCSGYRCSIFWPPWGIG